MRKHLQPILAATLAGLILLPGLGSSGLLDPWEMDRAASARVVAGPAQVLVVDSDGRLSGALAELPVSARRIETSDVLQSLRLAPNRLSERLSHAVVVDLERLKSKSDNTWREVARQLERIRSENRGTAVVLVSDDVERDQHSLAEGRARQLKRDMRGNISRWLMPEQPEAMAALMTGFERWATPEGWTDTLMAAIPSPWAQVQHKVSRHSSQGPLLDTWLVAGSLSVFGASEFGARLPGALLAMLMAALLFIGMELLFDSKTAWLSVLIYLSLPLTVGNARIVTFAQCAPIGVACTAFGVALGATRKCPNWWLWLTAGLVVLLFGRGLGGLTIGVSVVLGHLIISGGGDTRARWSALFALLALAGAALWVLSDDADPLLRTLRFTQVPFGGGIPEPERDFSTVIGMLGFALYPWGPLFLLAMGQALFADGDDSRQVALRALALAFAAPLLVVTAMFADFHQWTIPVAPVVAAVTAVWLVQLAERPSELRLPMSAIALWLIIPTVLLHREIGKEAATLVRWLTWDPPFGGEKAAFQWPQELKMNRGARAISLLLVVSFAVGLTRPLQWLKQLIAACRRRAVAVRAFSGVALLWAIDLLVSAGTRLEVTLHGEARRTGYNYDRVWTTIQCTRPEVIAGAVAVAVVLLGTMTPSWRLWSRLRRLFARLKLDGHVGLAVGAVLAVSQLVSGLLVWSSLHGWSGAFKVSHPAVLTPVGGALLAALLKWWAGRSSSNGDIWRLARDSSWLQWLSAPALFAVGGVGVAASQAAGTWTYGYLLATWGITLWLVIRAAQAGHGGDLRRVGLAGWGVAALTVTVLASALLTRLWPLMEEPGRYAMKLIIASPDTAALVGLLFGLAFIYLGQRSRWLDLHAYITSELVSVIERPALRTALPVVAALVLSSSYVFGLLPELGLHFSQKHLLERTGVDPRDPSGVLDEDGHPRVFKYAPSGGGSVTRNFYTQAMPSLIDKGALNKLLAGQDFATQISDFGPEGRSLAMALPGWPSTGEYKPQRGLYFGVAAKVEGRNITVAANAAGLRPSWQENQWRGATLVSGRGQRVQVVSNTADTLEVDTEPALTIGDAQRASFHLLPEGTTLLPKSTATRREQRFVVVPKDDFSALNFAYRRANKGHHISVVDARSSQLVLTATHLKEGQKDDSWIRDHVLNRADFDAIKGVKKTEVNFDDKVFLVGYHLKTPTVRRSRKYELDLYFEVRSGLASSYMIFMHPHPLHRDLWPLALHPKTKREEKRCTGCFQTNHWLKGDIVRVPVVQEVPLGTSAGQHDIIFGLYNPLNEKRLILKGGKGSGVFVHRDNRVTLTRLTVR